MTVKPFRFAAQGTPQDSDQWLALARRAEELGYTTLLMPDGMQLLSSFPALAVAAGATKSLHVGTFVTASPLRHPSLAAWDAHTLSVLTGGRFELGIGTGHPQVIKQAARLTGQQATAAERLALAEQCIDELRALDGDQHTPVMVAASGPKARALAAAKADIVTLATGALASREEIARLITEIKAAAGDRSGELEFATPVFIVGDEAPPWVTRFLDTDVATLAAHESLQLLRGTTTEMADELRRRRDTLGISYFSINAAFIEQFAPVIELLAGS